MNPQTEKTEMEIAEHCVYNSIDDKEALKLTAQAITTERQKAKDEIDLVRRGKQLIVDIHHKQIQELQAKLADAEKALGKALSTSIAKSQEMERMEEEIERVKAKNAKLQTCDCWQGDKRREEAEKEIERLKDVVYEEQSNGDDLKSKLALVLATLNDVLDNTRCDPDMSGNHRYSLNGPRSWRAITKAKATLAQIAGEKKCGLDWSIPACGSCGRRGLSLAGWKEGMK